MSFTNTANPAGSPKVSGLQVVGALPTEPAEFARFASLASKLVQVPKAEVDQRRQESS
jgi:hypothetical protein